MAQGITSEGVCVRTCVCVCVVYATEKEGLGERGKEGCL